MKRLFLISFLSFSLIGGFSIMLSHSDSNIITLGLDNVEALATSESSNTGTLYGNKEGTKFCCCPGTSSCGAAACSGC